MHCSTNPTVAVQTVDGQDFLLYAGRDGSLFLERVRPGGVRDGKSIFQFEPSRLLSAVSTVSTMTQPILTVERLVA